MAQLLRSIDFGKWENFEFPWLEEGDLPADPFGDFQTSANALSVWEVSEDESLIGRVAAATTVKRRSAHGRSVRRFDYILFDSDIVSDLNIDQRKTKGQTGYDSELDSGNHFDLIELSGRQLHRLIRRIRTRSKPEQIEAKKVIEHIRTSLKNRHMRDEDLNSDKFDKLKSELRNRLKK